MNRFVRSLAFVLVMVMCIGMLVACGNDTDGTTPDGTKPSTKPTETTPVEKDVVGIVTEVSGTFIVLDTYKQESPFIKYDKLVLDNLVLSGEKDYVYLSSTALYGHFTNGELKTLKKADLKVGDIIVVTENAKGTQQIVIMNYKTETPTDPTEATGK